MYKWINLLSSHWFSCRFRPFGFIRGSIVFSKTASDVPDMLSVNVPRMIIQASSVRRCISNHNLENFSDFRGESSGNWIKPSIGMCSLHRWKFNGIILYDGDEVGFLWNLLEPRVTIQVIDNIWGNIGETNCDIDCSCHFGCSWEVVRCIDWIGVIVYQGPKFVLQELVVHLW